MGMCDTALPGCRQASFKQLYFPRLVFNFSRPYFYNHNETNSTTQKLIQEAMAWAFSAMPEAIQVVLQELEQREKDPNDLHAPNELEELQQQTAVPNYGFGAYSQPNQNQFGFNNGQQQNNWFNSPQATGNTQQMPQAFGKWWNTQRRLTAKRMGVDGALDLASWLHVLEDPKTLLCLKEGRPVEMPSKLMSHQAEVQFRNGLPYRVDHVLLKKMIKSGMIPVDDGHSKKLGKLNIIGFYFEDLGAIQVPESDVHARAGPHAQQLRLLPSESSCVLDVVTPATSHSCSRQLSAKKAWNEQDSLMSLIHCIQFHVQSSIEQAVLASASLRTLELTTSQKLADGTVTQLLENCPNLSFLDVGHCCQLVEPKLTHPILETILLSFCVNLRESAVAGLFENCPKLRYVEIAVCMFDMTKFQRTFGASDLTFKNWQQCASLRCRPECTVVVNFDF
eukprot:g33584.t1